MTFWRQCNENGYVAACSIESYDGIHVLSYHFWLCFASCVRISKDWLKNSEIGQGIYGMEKIWVHFIYDVDFEESSETWMNLSSSPFENLTWNFYKIVAKATISVEESNPAPPETWETRTQNYVRNTLST